MEASRYSCLRCAPVGARHSARGDEAGVTRATPKPSHQSELEGKRALLHNPLLNMDFELFESTQLSPGHAGRQPLGQSWAARTALEMPPLVRTASAF